MMILTPLAAAVVTTFANGNSNAIVDLRDGSIFFDDVDASIDLPDGQTVTAASMQISTEPSLHAAHQRIDLYTMPRVWNPAQNNQLTSFSDASAFEFESESAEALPVTLKTDGFVTDFEGTTANFRDTSPPPFFQTGWNHGSITAGSTHPASCSSGDECWGTGMSDTNYTDDNGGQAFEYILEAEPMFVANSLKNFNLTFETWFNFRAVAGSQPNSKQYIDCGYVEIRSNLENNFPIGDQDYDYVAFSYGSGSGSDFNQGDGLYQRSTGSSNGQINYRCGGVPSSSGSNFNYGLGGSSTSSNRQNGWGTLAIDLSTYVDQYVQIRFVMEHNTLISGQTLDWNLSGWYIDDVRLGDKLAQEESMTVRGITPSVLGGANHPNGYGLLTLEAEMARKGSLTVDVMDLNGNLVVGRDGSVMENLEGEVIELWNINSTLNPTVNLKFVFNSGPARLSSAVLHGFSLGTRVGTGFNGTQMAGPTSITNGVWNSQGGNMPFMFSPTTMDSAFNPALERSSFTYPIASIKPYIQDDCSESPSIEVSSPGITGSINLTDGTKYTLDSYIFGFSAAVSYVNPCGVAGIWFDLEFAHHPEMLSIDVAEDGDKDWGFDEPAFGAFGHQNKFLLNKVNGVNYGTDKTTLTLNQNGEAEGGYFMLPKGAVVTYAEVSFDQNSILSSSDLTESFSLELLSGTQSESLGSLQNLSIITNDFLSSPLDLKDAINALLTNPLTPTSHYDAYGCNTCGEWMTFRFKASAPSAQTGTSAVATGLDIVYDYTMTFDEDYGFDTELNQGVALWTGGSTATVPVGVYSSTGGGANFGTLSVSTSSGFSNTFIDTGNPVGLYPNGEIYEFTTEHTVSDITGTSMSEAWLSFESKSGHTILKYSDFASFSKDNLGYGDLITLEPSTVSDITDGKQIIWRFSVNPEWEDAGEVRVYAGLTAANGVNGLPDAILFAPQIGNAVENDAGIISFELQNTVGVAQDLDAAESGQTINLVGSVRLEDLDVAPDPAAYNLVLELKHVNITGEDISIEWEEVENFTGVIGGDFNLEIDLGSVAGDETYRFGMRGYEGGNSLCPASSLRPDETCSIPFNISIDTYEPNLMQIQVLSKDTDRNIDSNWRTLYDDTWVVPSATQSIRMTAQDLPSPPATLDMYYWVENDHDANDDRIPDEDEYIVLTLYSDGNAPNATYYGNFSDNANLGLDPEGLVSIYIVGFDLAGNAIDGGTAGFDNDKITYVSMQSESPVIRNFFIENSKGERFLNSNSQQYEGEWNMTMYAGNTYHLLVEANDDNGWRDVDYIQVDLDDARNDMSVYYFPRNQTAWTDSPHITIVQEDDDNDGPTLRKMDGSALVNPFISDFYLDLPIRVDWGILGEGGAANTPVLYMKDLDNPEYRMLPAPGRYIQSWYYGSDLRLDVRDDFTNNMMISPYFADSTGTITRDVREGFVYTGDTVWFTGQYVFQDGYPTVFMNPETELTLKVTRLAAAADGTKGYSSYPAGGADATMDFGQPTLHNFTGGQFNISVIVPSVTNEYTYEFELVNLPENAVDLTSSFCANSNTYGCATFKLKVDGNAPSVTSLTVKKGATGDQITETTPISTANYHCLDINGLLIEREGLLAGDVQVGWMFYTDADNGIVWNKYQTHFGSAEPQMEPLTLVPSGNGVYTASATCLDLWPLENGEFDPEQESILGIEVAIWIQGVDSTGSSVILGGGPNEDGSVAQFVGTNQNLGVFDFTYERAVFQIGASDVSMTPSSPEVGDTPTLRIRVVNSGTLDGQVTLEVRSVIDGGIPNREGNVTSVPIQVDGFEYVSIDLEKFGRETTGMYYIIYNEETNEQLWNGKDNGVFFNVKVASEDDSSGGLVMIISIMGVVLAVLGTLVVVLLRRNSGGENLLDDDYDDDDDDYEEDAKALVDIPANRSSADPEMQRALDLFPQWTEADIQGYFDQGWSVEQLQDWVNSN
jgi:hypothetical protein